MKLGPYELNTIVTGDALEFLRAFPAGSVPMFLFSPPYNLGTSTGGGMPAKSGHYPKGASLGKRGGNGKWGGGSLADGYGEYNDAMPMAEYIKWQQDILFDCWSALSPAGAIYYNHKPRILDGELVSPVDYVPAGLKKYIRQEVIWARAGGVNFSPSFYVPTHERIVIIARPEFRLRSKGASGVGDVWYIPQESGTWHPAPFPVELATRAIETVTPEFVVDPFAGSGTTAVAAKSLGVNYLCNELSAAYSERARARVDNTPVPLFTLQHEQLEMGVG